MDSVQPSVDRTFRMIVMKHFDKFSRLRISFESKNIFDKSEILMHTYQCHL